MISVLLADNRACIDDSELSIKDVFQDVQKSPNRQQYNSAAWFIMVFAVYDSIIPYHLKQPQVPGRPRSCKEGGGNLLTTTCNGYWLSSFHTSQSIPCQQAGEELCSARAGIHTLLSVA